MPKDQYILKGRNFVNKVASSQYHVRNNIETFIWGIARTEKNAVLELFSEDSIPKL